MVEMSVDSLRNNLGNPARTYLWEVIVPSPLEGSSETIMYRAQTTSIPERSFGEILVPFKQSAGIKFPGKIHYTQKWDITFVEGEDREMLVTFYDWMNDIIDDKFMIGRVDYKTDIYLHLLNTDRSVAKRIKLVGCYPERIADVQLGMEPEEKVMFTVTMSFDRWELV